MLQFPIVNTPTHISKLKLCISIALAGLVLWGAHASSGRVGSYAITEVFDGDTIAVDMLGTSEKVRMIGVDTPETVDPRKVVQCFGPEASSYTHSHLRPGVRVRLVADPLSTNRDRYNRLLRYVYLDDGTLYNQKLLELGYAKAYTGFPFSKMETFNGVQVAAQTNKAGMWSGCGS